MKQGPEGASALPGAQLSPGAGHPGPGQDAAVGGGATGGVAGARPSPCRRLHRYSCQDKRRLWVGGVGSAAHTQQPRVTSQVVCGDGSGLAKVPHTCAGTGQVTKSACHRPCPVVQMGKLRPPGDRAAGLEDPPKHTQGLLPQLPRTS